MKSTIANATTSNYSRRHLKLELLAFDLDPESETMTRTFVLVYSKADNKLGELIFPFIKDSILKAFSVVVEQDARVLESLYQAQKPQIRLPKEEVMFDAERLYQTW